MGIDEHNGRLEGIDLIRLDIIIQKITVVSDIHRLDFIYKCGHRDKCTEAIIVKDLQVFFRESRDGTERVIHNPNNGLSSVCEAVTI